MRLKNLVIAALLPLTVATHAVADECDPNDPGLLKPDLAMQPPRSVRITQRGGHRILAFSTVVGNVGDGPMILHGHTVTGPNGSVTQASQEIFKQDGTSCTQTAGFFVYHPTHRHFHFADFSNYEVRKDDPFTGEVVAASDKVSFCLLDILRLPGFHTFPQLIPDCLNPEGQEGISVGWADVYDSFLPGQQIDLDTDPTHPIAAGNYFLVLTVNPQKRLWEKDPDGANNIRAVSVKVPPLKGPLAHHVGSGGPRPPHSPRSPRPPMPVTQRHSRGPGTPHSPHRPPQQP